MRIQGRRVIFGILCSIGVFQMMHAQQTPVFANYNYNTVLINPAHAGYYPDTDVTFTNRGYLNSFEGSPRNLGVSLNSPMAENTMGLGIGITHDEVGVTTTTNISAAYAYKIIFDTHYNRARWWEYNPDVLSFGITAGATIYNEDLVSLGLTDDPNFANNINTVIPTIGAGILYNNQNFYVGVSAPNLLGTSLSSEDNVNYDNVYYARLGYRFFATRFQNVLLTPNTLIKYVSGAPLQADFNVLGNYQNKFEAGVGYRTNSSINVLAGFHLWNHWRILYHYNQSLKDTPIGSTHGLILSYRFGEGFGSR